MMINDFKARFPEFSNEVVDQYFPPLENAWQCYYGKPYTACNKEIILNLLAHLMTLAQSKGASSVRQQSSRSVGSVSVGFEATASSSNLTDFFGATKYGQAYLFLTSTRRRAYFV